MSNSDRKTALVVALFLCAPNINAASAIYVGTGTGPYKSTDNGATFVPLAAKIGANPHPLLRGVPSISDIAIDPKNSRIVYMVGLYRVGGGSHRAALMRTTDGGETWKVEPLSAESAGQAVKIYIDPVATNVVYLHDLVQFTAFRSLDSGTTWTSITGLPPSTRNAFGVLAVDPRVTAVVYAKVWGSVTVEEIVYKSVDYGFSWIAIGKAAGARGGHIFVDPRNSRNLILTAVAVCSNGIGACGPFHSSDGGVTWTNQGLRGSIGGGSGQAIPRDFGPIVYDPRTDRLYMSADLSNLGQTILSSPDGGTWTPIASDPRNLIGVTGPAPLAADGTEGLALYTYTRELFGENPHKVIKSIDGGRTWAAQAGLPLLCPQNPNQPCPAGPFDLDRNAPPIITAIALPPIPTDDLLNVSAANGVGGVLASGSIAAAVGANLSQEVLIGDGSATSLGGVSVTIADAAGNRHAAKVLFVSPR
jgi:photosystem II stability/assembly factor-like uncharacterized protein